MKTFRITNGFDKMTDAYLLVKANFIWGSMNANPAFPTPTPTYADVKSSIDAFAAAIQAAESGDKQAIATRNQTRQELINQLHLLGNYVQFAAAGNEVVATSSGFPVSKPAEPRPAITTPEGLQLKNGLNRGELELSFPRVAGATAYVHEITPSPVTAESQWQSVMNTLRKNVFTGLESGKEYTCRVAAIGAKQQLAYSDVVSRIAL